MAAANKAVQLAKEAANPSNASEAGEAVDEDAHESDGEARPPPVKWRNVSCFPKCHPGGLREQA